MTTALIAAVYTGGVIGGILRETQDLHMDPEFLSGFKQILRRSYANLTQILRRS